MLRCYHCSDDFITLIINFHLVALSTADGECEWKLLLSLTLTNIIHCYDRCFHCFEFLDIIAYTTALGNKTLVHSVLHVDFRSIFGTPFAFIFPDNIHQVVGLLIQHMVLGGRWVFWKDNICCSEHVRRSCTFCSMDFLRILTWC